MTTKPFREPSGATHHRDAIATGDSRPNTNKHSVIARYSDFCAVGPSPELRDRWTAELQRVKKRGTRAETNALGLERKPRRLGFDDGVIIPPEEFPLGTPVSVISRAAADRAPLRGTVRVIVVLVQFSDKAMGNDANHFRDLFFSTGVLPHGSVKEYYNEVTNGLVSLSGDVVGPYQMPQTLAWYANNNYGIGKGGGAFRSPQLAHDAAVAADPDVNFGPYDNDGNGFVDAFIVVHAGQGAEVTGNAGDIWSHKSTLATAYSTDNTKIYGYLTIPEDAKIGVCAHELGHLLFGFPDLYDTDYTSEGIGNWCLMAGGSWNGGGDVPAHPSAWCKANQGWASVTSITANGSVTIPDVKTSHNLLRLWKDGTAGPEYFLVENRQRTGFDADLPGDGLLAWHIDENQPGNTDENHYKVGLLQADGNRDLELNHNRGDAGDPYPGSSNNTSLTAGSTPNTKSYAGQDTCVSITSISPSGPTMTATISVHCGKTLVKDLKDGPKDLKDGPKDVKDLRKDTKELAKDLKDGRKDLKDGPKDVKDLRKDIKELAKDLKDGRKDIKESLKDSKDAAKEGKDLKEGAGDKPFDRPGGGDLGGGGFGADAGYYDADSGAGYDRVGELEARVAALEATVAAGAAQPFIGSDLRPDLIGGPAAEQGNLTGRMASGDPSAKREFDTTPC
ncbi:M6 family metalloprotease domain-containing protein [Mycobacterium aquaticum]|uniref:M6 family metalloprotease domain-containing protein n=1 Tax=Mycobacterium aquaticum TaxID=1927124 RepID=UPI0009F68358|nr:M6 family metalloprotease domain-containing protein [Mycobacterium aquaticum]